MTVARADELVSDGKAAVLIEAQTGNVLYEKNAIFVKQTQIMNKKLPCYFIKKIMVYMRKPAMYVK